jgi:hypothetical protein
MFHGFNRVSPVNAKYPSPWQLPGETHMAMALFTDALDRPPGSHVHFDTHVRWVTVAEKLLVEPDS